MISLVMMISNIVVIPLSLVMGCFTESIKIWVLQTMISIMIMLSIILMITAGDKVLLYIGLCSLITFNVLSYSLVNSLF